MRIFGKLSEVPEGKHVRFVGKRRLSRHDYLVYSHPFHSPKVLVSNFGFSGLKKGDSVVVYETDASKSLFRAKKGGR
jgi:3-mercaptopyruvate sulfurtransferase SseA